MELVIREENENDYSSVEDLVKKAFEIDRDAKAGEHELAVLVDALVLRLVLNCLWFAVGPDLEP